MPKVYKIRGHHLETLERFVWNYGRYSEGEVLYLKCETEGYTKKLIENEIKIWTEFSTGKCKDECPKRSGRGYPGNDDSCRGPKYAKHDVKIATEFGLEIGKVYNYEEIKLQVYNHLVHIEHVPDTDFLRSVLKINQKSANIELKKFL